MDDSSFIQAILEDPASDHPRLVYADALDERGECARAEFIRVQCELARIESRIADVRRAVAEGRRGLRPPEKLLRRAEALGRRERELLNQSGWGAWVPDLPGLAWRLNDDPLCQHDLAFLACTFRRGLVGSVTLTASQFLGGPCGQCEEERRHARRYAREGQHTAAASRLAGAARCPACHGTGRIEGLAAALFRAAPITEVRLSDREPDSIGNGRLAWWYTDPDWHSPGLYQHHWLPVELRPHLTGRICEPNDEPRPGVCGFNYGDLSPETDGVELALADLSAACVAVGRDRTELPALSRMIAPVPRGTLS